MTALILRADARALPMPDASVDLIVASPPYFGLRSYTDAGEHYDGQIGAETTPVEFVAALVECTRDWMRVLKPTGSIFVNLGDSYYSAKGASTGVDAKSEARRFGIRSLDRPGMGYPRKTLLLLPERYRIACLDELGLTVRAVVVWDKPNGLPESVGDRVHRSHEDWVHLTKRPRYFADMDEIREKPARWDAPRKLGTSNKTQRHLAATDNTGWKDHLVSPNPKGKLPGSVRAVATEPFTVPDHIGHARCCGGVKVDGCESGLDHHAAFPTAWPSWLIRGWCPAGGVTLDPFGGTGTTALVASVLGRIGVSVDRSADYCRIAGWRTGDPGQRARALGLPKPPVQIDGQGDLFADLEDDAPVGAA